MSDVASETLVVVCLSALVLVLAVYLSSSIFFSIKARYIKSMLKLTRTFAEEESNGGE